MYHLKYTLAEKKTADKIITIDMTQAIMRPVLRGLKMQTSGVIPACKIGTPFIPSGDWHKVLFTPTNLSGLDRIHPTNHNK